MTRRPLWAGSITALAAAAAVIVVIMIRGTAPPPPNSTFEAAMTNYLQSEQHFTSSAGLQSLDAVAMAVANEFELSLRGGVRFEHLPSGKAMA